MRAMGEMSAEDLAQLAFNLSLISEQQLKQTLGQFGVKRPTFEEMKQHLLRRELLTNYQVERIMRGERSGFFYGKYMVLYLIGTGTFARVYRAKHSETGDMM